MKNELNKVIVEKDALFRKFAPIIIIVIGLAIFISTFRDAEDVDSSVSDYEEVLSHLTADEYNAQADRANLAEINSHLPEEGLTERTRANLEAMAEATKQRIKDAEDK